MKLIEIQSLISSSEATLQNLEKEIVNNPNLPSIKVSYNSIKLHKEKLEKQFFEKAKKEEINICDYRIIPDKETISLSGLGELLKLFQSLYSSLYEALLSGEPRDRTKFSINSLFNFGFSYPGSLGLIFTLPNDEVLFENNINILAFKKFNELTKISSIDEISSLGKLYGKSVLRSLFNWVKHHLDNEYEAKIVFSPPKENIIEMQLQRGRLEFIFNLLNSSSDKFIEEISIIGELVAIDLPKGSFRLQNEESDIRGFFSGDFELTHTKLEVPKIYKAEILKESEIKYSTDKEEIKYYLKSLTLV